MYFRKSKVQQWGLVLGMLATLGVVQQGHVAAQTPKTDTIDQKEKRGWGKFELFKEGTLTLQSNAGTLLVWNQLSESTKTLKYDPDSKGYKPVESTLDALSQVKAGTWVVVGDRRANIHIGARKGSTVGTFVSFKNDRLLMLGKNLGESFTKKYGNSLHFNKFAAEVPVYESVDGGEYRLIGTANKVLGDVKEGTIVTVHAEGDDNITLIQLGVPKTK